MEERKSDEVSGGAINQSRRDALMRFGRYAAMASTVMVLLRPRVSFAGKGKGGGRGRDGGWGKGGGRGKGHDSY